MQAFGKYFEFNGISSEEFNVIMCTFDSPETKSDTAISYEISRTELNPVKGRTRTYCKKYSDVLTFNFSIIKCDHTTFSKTERRNIVAWLTSPIYPQLFRITDVADDDYHDGIEYFATCVGYSEYNINGIAGLYFEFECNAPYGFSPVETTTFTSEGSVTFVINNTSDELYADYYPILHLTGLEQGTVTISSDRYPDNVMELNILQAQTLDIDCEAGIITDNAGLFDYSKDTNLKWLKLPYGENTITITGLVTGHIKCRYIRKVGI